MKDELLLFYSRFREQLEVISDEKCLFILSLIGVIGLNEPDAIQVFTGWQIQDIVSHWKRIAIAELGSDRFGSYRLSERGHYWLKVLGFFSNDSLYRPLTLGRIFSVNDKNQTCVITDMGGHRVVATRSNVVGTLAKGHLVLFDTKLGLGKFLAKPNNNAEQTDLLNSSPDTDSSFPTPRKPDPQ